MGRNGVAVVTGASAGIGRAVAHRFARAGFGLGLIARDSSALEDVQAEIQRLGGKAVVAPADVADADAVFAAARRIEAELGAIDIWVNDAMETVFSPLTEMTPQEFRRVTEVTYLGLVHGTMAALKSMRPRGRGMIIQIGSALAYRGIPLQSAYCGAKHAVRGFTDSLRCELLYEKSPIKLRVVDPPAVNTPQFDWARTHMGRRPRPMGRPVEPEVVAEAVFRAARGSWREYWLGSGTLLTVLANTLLPSLLDHYLAATGVKGQETKEPVGAERRDNLERPVRELHRTRGSFENEAADRAILVPGEAARLGVVLAGALLFFLLGAAFVRRPRA